jgi:hypothetical protein
MHHPKSQLEALANDRQAELRRARNRGWSLRTKILTRPGR